MPRVPDELRFPNDEVAWWVDAAVSDNLYRRTDACPKARARVHAKFIEERAELIRLRKKVKELVNLKALVNL